MKTNISLSIPEPCSENWDNFTTASNGRHCGSCNKTVIDFTNMSDRQILEFLKNKPAHTCGRFRADQLKTYSNQLPIKINPGLALLKAGFMSLLLALASKNAAAQTTSIGKVKTEVVDQSTYATKENTITNPEQKIKGIVKSGADQSPLVGISIYLKGSTVGTTSDETGKFEFPKELNEGDTLIFNYIGFETLEYAITKNTTANIDISMNESYVLMGAVAVNEIYTPKQSAIARFWGKIKSIF
ncbi:MAG TPA: carboxypeptidase-like regulatory domain-containing protein [Cyclobacteriaceae bacterium]